MTISEAYCVELERNVTIEEAHEEFHGRGSGKRLNSSCADAACRYERGTKPIVSGVNYGRAPDDLGRVVMHFRRIPPDDHQETCRYAEHERAIEAIDRIPGLPRTRRLRASQFITRLDLAEPAPRVNASEARPVASAPSGGAGGTTTAEALYARLCRSSRLYRVVDCYLLMDSKERIKTSLTIGALSTDYQRAFVYSESWNEYQHPKILRGYARYDEVRGCPTLTLHRREQSAPSIRIRLTEQLLGTSRLARTYLQYVRDLSRKSRYAIRLFAIGKPMCLDQEIDFRVEHLNHLVVMDRAAGE